MSDKGVEWQLKKIVKVLEKINEAQLAGVRMIKECPAFDEEVGLGGEEHG